MLVSDCWQVALSFVFKDAHWELNKAAMPFSTQHAVSKSHARLSVPASFFPCDADPELALDPELELEPELALDPEFDATVTSFVAPPSPAAVKSSQPSTVLHPASSTSVPFAASASHAALVATVRTLPSARGRRASPPAPLWLLRALAP